MARRIVTIGGGAAGIGAAGAARGTDRDAEITVYTEYEDAAYSPCGIPYVHGGEIPDFERLFLAGKQAYVDAGIDVHYETAVTAIDTAAQFTLSGAASFDEITGDKIERDPNNELAADRFRLARIGWHGKSNAGAGIFSVSVGRGIRRSGHRGSSRDVRSPITRISETSRLGDRQGRRQQGGPRADRPSRDVRVARRRA